MIDTQTSGMRSALRRPAGWTTLIVAAFVLMSASCASDEPGGNVSAALGDSGPKSDGMQSGKSSSKDEKGAASSKKTADRASGSSTARSPGVPARVVRIIDGDTVEAAYRGDTETIRLIGIDTPETVHPSKPVECFGKAASAFTSESLLHERVRLEFDVERTDRYGRTLAYVWVGRRLFNRTVVARGFAHVATYPPNVKYVEVLRSAQRKARNNNFGLWASCPSGGSSGGAVASDAAQGNSGSSQNCDPNYSGACIPTYPPDLDCGEVSATNFRSTGSDPHGFDGDGDGLACES